MRNQKADKLVKSEAEKIRTALRSLAQKKKKSPAAKLNSYEQLVAGALSRLKGDMKAHASLAASEVRIQTGQRNFFIEGLEVSPRYLSTMEEIFRRHKLPIELTRIPFVESSFNKHATSKVGATGIWQFMGNTGRKFMTVNEVIDERRSPFKASEGAARLLKENYIILYRSWPLAVTAWNHGPGGVRKASKAAQSRDLGVIVSRYRSRTFDFASSNFYAEFLAALHAEFYKDSVFGPVAREPKLDIQIVKLRRSVRVAEVMQATGLAIERFLLMNPDLKKAVARNIILPAGFRVHVPANVRNAIERRLAIGEDSPLRNKKSS
jgi:membrane-bound lytic murein transglycosylase D